MTQKKLGSKNPFPVNERLNDLAELMVNNCSMNQLTNKKYMAKAMAMLPQNSSRYGIVIPVAFTVPVLKDNNGDFYFDSKNNSSPFHLFKGSSKNKSGHALDLFSEKDLGELLFSHLNKSSKLNKTVAGCVGVAVKVNEKTFGSSSIPSANVVILLGVSRLKLVKG